MERLIPPNPPMASDTTPTVTIRRAAELADVSRRTVYNWLRQGKLQWRRTAGGYIRIDPDSLFRPGGDLFPQNRS